MRRLLSTDAPAATILIRIAVGGIFLTEGIQKFLYPRDLGAGRFAKIGIPAPDMMGPFVGGIEIVCGALLIIGLLTRLAHRYQRSDCFDQDSHFARPRFLVFSLTKLPRYGFLSTIHEARTDLAMWFSLLFLLIVGAGKTYSLDAALTAAVTNSDAVR